MSWHRGMEEIKEKREMEKEIEGRDGWKKEGRVKEI